MDYHGLFNIRKTHEAFRVDSFASTRPMTNEVSTPDEISDQFDDIAYDKCMF
jgi:aminopeptidase N